MCAIHMICRKYEITVRGRLGLMEQSDLDTTSANQKRGTHLKDTETGCTIRIPLQAEVQASRL